MILGLDLGTTTGFACLGDMGIVSGVWRLPPADPSRAYAALLMELERGLLPRPGSAKPPDLVAYEDVPGRAHLSGDSAHRWGGYEAILLATCERGRVPFLGIKPATWKKVAGLRSGTGPEAALHAAREKWPRKNFATADEAVARWVALAAAGREP